MYRPTGTIVGGEQVKGVVCVCVCVVYKVALVAPFQKYV